MVWACLLLAPWLWLFVALHMLRERGFSMLHFRYCVTPSFVYSILETEIVISDCPQLIASSASLSFFRWVFLWALSQTSVGLEFSNQHVMSAHLVTVLCSPGIKFNAALRAVGSAEEKWTNTKPAACLFSVLHRGDSSRWPPRRGSLKKTVCWAWQEKQIIFGNRKTLWQVRYHGAHLWKSNGQRQSRSQRTCSKSL